MASGADAPHGATNSSPAALPDRRQGELVKVASVATAASSAEQASKAAVASAELSKLASKVAAASSDELAEPASEATAASPDLEFLGDASQRLSANRQRGKVMTSGAEMMLSEVADMVRDEIVDSGTDAPDGSANLSSAALPGEAPDGATNPSSAALPDRLQGEVMASGADAPDGATGPNAAALPVQPGRAHSAAAARPQPGVRLGVAQARAIGKLAHPAYGPIRMIWGGEKWVSSLGPARARDVPGPRQTEATNVLIR